MGKTKAWINGLFFAITLVYVAKAYQMLSNSDKAVSMVTIEEFRLRKSKEAARKILALYKGEYLAQYR